MASKLVLIGPAGSGKSTFGRYLALCLAGDLLGRTSADLTLLNRDRASEAGVELAPELRAWPHRAPVPFFVELRKLVADAAFPADGVRGTAKHLFSYLAGRDEGVDLGPLLREVLAEEYGALLILDGLDETPAAEATRGRLKQVIEGFASAWPRCRILVTSRPYAYADPNWKLDGFASEKLAPFDREKRAAFVHAWYAHLATLGQVDRDQVGDRSQDLVRQIEGSRHLPDLAERPLMLTMITDLHATTGGRIPGGRAALYEKSVDLLLDRWNQVRHEISLASQLGMDTTQLRHALEGLAYRVHKDRGKADEKEAVPITDVELWQALQAERPKDCKVDELEVRKYLWTRSGILVSESETIYRFPHRSYQEYLAACHLTNKQFPDLLVAELRAEPSLWREVFQLAVGRTSEPSFTAWALLEALDLGEPEGGLTPGDPRFEQVLCAGLALEETGLWRTVENHTRTKLERIRAWLQKTVELGALSPVDRAAAGRVLGRLGDRRSGIGIDERKVPVIEWVEIPAGPFLMGDEKRKVTLRQGFKIARYPVTNSQFQAFVDDGGYTKAWRRCWTDEGWKWKVDEDVQGPADSLPESGLLPNYPRVNVSWFEAVAFTRWLAEKSREPIVLPTEHQWERTARSTDGRAYPWGDDPAPSRMNYDETGIGSPCAVGIFPTGASPEGVLDLSGNVLEWTSSPWRDEPEDRAAEQEDLAADPGARRVIRGGGCWFTAVVARSAYRGGWRPGLRFDYLGFRVLLPCPPTRGPSFLGR